MPYCVNCGTQYHGTSAICGHCLLDPTVLESTIENYLKNVAVASDQTKRLEFSYPGEKVSLILATALLFIVTCFLGTLTFGLFILILAAGIFSLKLTNARNKGLMIQLSKNNFPQLFSLTKLVCYRLKMSLLPVYITQDPNYNAYTQGFLSDAWVVLNSGTVEDFTPEELAFVIGHEVAHVKRKHTTWLTLMSPASGILSSMISLVMRPIFNLWSLKCEFTADRGGLIATRSIDSAATALVKLSTGAKLVSQVDWKGLLKDYKNQETLSTRLTELLGTHPFPINRIKELWSFSKSKTFSCLLG